MIGSLVGGMMLSVTGAWLVDRGLRWRARGLAPEPIRLLAVIEAPIRRAWDELVDIEGQPRWMHDMKVVRMDGLGPIRIGSRGEATVRMYGITLTDPVTITVLDAPHRFGISHEGIFAGRGLFDLEPGADGTTTIVRWEEALLAPILPHLGAAVTAPIFRTVFQADLDRFTALVEATT